jgi:hypothetical protein
VFGQIMQDTVADAYAAWRMNDAAEVHKAFERGEAIIQKKHGKDTLYGKFLCQRLRRMGAQGVVMSALGYNARERLSSDIERIRISNDASHLALRLKIAEFLPRRDPVRERLTAVVAKIEQKRQDYSPQQGERAWPYTVDFVNMLLDVPALPNVQEGAVRGGWPSNTFGLDTAAGAAIRQVWGDSLVPYAEAVENYWNDKYPRQNALAMEIAEVGDYSKRFLVSNIKHIHYLDQIHEELEVELRKEFGKNAPTVSKLDLWIWDAAIIQGSDVLRTILHHTNRRAGSPVKRLLRLLKHEEIHDLALAPVVPRAAGGLGKKAAPYPNEIPEGTAEDGPSVGEFVGEVLEGKNFHSTCPAVAPDRIAIAAMRKELSAEAFERASRHGPPAVIGESLIVVGALAAFNAGQTLNRIESRGYMHGALTSL